MKNIVYYISDHGFGHTTRSIAILRELLNYENIQVTMKTGKPLSFLKNSLKKFNNIEFSHSSNDVGLILKENSLQVDKETLQLKVRGWVNNWHHQIGEEAKFLNKNNIDMIISDITPWVFPAADRARVPAIAISNFTWYDQYKELIGKDRAVEIIGDAYQKVNLFLQYPLHLDSEKVKNIKEIGFLCRKFNQEKINSIKNDWIQNDKQNIFVGIGKSLSPAILRNINFQDLKKYNWLFTDNIEIEGDNIYVIPENELEIQNYIAASDYVLAKPGWGTVAESLLAQVPMLLLNLQEIPETRKIIKDIKKMGTGLTIDIDDFYNLENIETKLNDLDQLNQENFDYENQRKEVASIIHNYINT